MSFAIVASFLGAIFLASIGALVASQTIFFPIEYAQQEQRQKSYVGCFISSGICLIIGIYFMTTQTKQQNQSENPSVIRKANAEENLSMSNSEIHQHYELKLN